MGGGGFCVYCCNLIELAAVAAIIMVDFKGKTADFKRLFDRGFKSVSNVFKTGWAKVKTMKIKK